MKLRPEIKERWLKALRSGNYIQGQGCLRKNEDPNKFCCLGVLADIMELETEDNAARYSYLFPLNGDQRRNAYMIPVPYMEKLMEETNEPVRLPHGDITDVQELINHLAAHMNDTGESFETIAQFIEEHL